MDALRRRLFIAMGLPPIAAAVSGCFASPPPTAAAPAPEVPTELRPRPTVAEEPAPQGPPSAPEVVAPVLRLDNGPSLIQGHVAIFTLAGWHANVPVTLEALDGGSAIPLASGRTDLSGAAQLRVAVPAALRAGVWPLQLNGAVPLGELPVITVTPDHPGVTELSPATPDAIFAAGGRWRACVPQESYGDCPSILDFHPWQSIEITSYALDRAWPPNVPLQGCAEETAFVGSCCYLVASWQPPSTNVCGLGEAGDTAAWDTASAPGRPFRVAERARVARVVAGDGWSMASAFAAPPGRLAGALARGWLRAALGEHASVASFARFTLQLMSLGAPAELVARACAAQADEVRHAALCFGLAAQFGGEPVAPGGLPIGGALDASGDLAAIVHAAVVEGCVQETISAAQVAAAALRVRDPALADQLRGVAEDEARHAELSWAFVRWALQTHPHLAAVVEAAFDTPPAPSEGPADDELAPWGLLSAKEEDEIARRVQQEVLAPCRRALLQAEVRSCA